MRLVPLLSPILVLLLVFSASALQSQLTITVTGAILPVLSESLNSITLTSSNVGQNISVRYSITKMKQLAGWQFNVYFEHATFLNITVPTENVWKEAYANNTVFQIPPINTTDFVMVGAVILGHEYIMSEVAGTLCELIFQLAGNTGDIARFLVRTDPNETLFVNADGQRIPFAVREGDKA